MIVVVPAPDILLNVTHEQPPVMLQGQPAPVVKVTLSLPVDAGTFAFEFDSV